MSEATFRAALEHTLAIEGVYSDDPDDRGGETYRGISRRYHPSWEGWTIIDRLKACGELDTAAPKPELAEAVARFYRRTFWEPLLLDELLDKVPAAAGVAGELFDTAINCGVVRAATWLQTALNALNRNQAMYPDLVVDGRIGAKTLGACVMLAHRDKRGPALLVKLIDVQQGAHYLALMGRSPEQEKYARGWFGRRVFVVE